MEKLMNEENEWDHRILTGVKGAVKRSVSTEDRCGGFRVTTPVAAFWAVCK